LLRNVNIGRKCRSEDLAALCFRHEGLSNQAIDFLRLGIFVPILSAGRNYRSLGRERRSERIKLA
jgi:hypothetical protein